MPFEYFDRYSQFKNNGKVKPVPGIFLSPKATDKTITYRLGKTRLDQVSENYYGNPFHGFLILAANPQFGGLEFLIPDQEELIVPYPFQASLQQYQEEISKRKKLYGI